MLKQGSKWKDEDTFIPGQVYHIDLSFVGGPSNLEDVSAGVDRPNLTMKQGCDWYIGFLTIINVATQQLWIHLIKNKDPPTLYIDTFLKRHGIRQTDPWKAITTTSGTGYLAKSKAFTATVNHLKYKI